MRHRGVRDRGFALIAALFLVVIVGIMGGAMMLANRAQQLADAQEILNAQAYQAARAGMQYGIYRVNAWVAPLDCPAGATVLTPAEWNGRFAVTVTCAATVSPGPPVTITEYRITAKACLASPGCGPGSDYASVERQISASVARVDTAAARRVFVREDF